MPEFLTPPFTVFPNAPIREALIDVRTELPSHCTTDDLRSIGAKIREEYPNEQVRRILQRVIHISDKSHSTDKTLSETIEGYQFWNTDKTQVVQFRRNGFTFSRLRPYKNWEHLRDEARRLWSIFSSSAEPIQVTRLAVRFINTIEIPGRQLELDRYFTAPPRLPDLLPHVLTEGFSRYSMQFPKQNAMAIVQFAFPHGPIEDSTKVLLDIDVFQDRTISPPFDSVWECLEDLRILKDNIFFRYITADAEALFQ